MARKATASNDTENLGFEQKLWLAADSRSSTPTAEVTLAPHGVADFIFANGLVSPNQAGDCPARSTMKTPKAKPQSLARQRGIRRAPTEADLVSCMMALLGHHFYSTQIPVFCRRLREKGGDVESYGERCRMPVSLLN